MNKLSLIIISFYLLLGIRVIAGSNTTFSNSEDILFYQTENLNLEVNLYPNPLKGETITIKSNIGFYKIEILNIVGNLLLDKRYPEKTTFTTIDLDRFKKGIYIVKISYDKNVYYLEKLIIQ